VENSVGQTKPLGLSSNSALITQHKFNAFTYGELHDSLELTTPLSINSAAEEAAITLKENGLFLAPSLAR
jgi:hypothetical protein